MRIATTSLRTSLAMTGIFARGTVGRDDVGIVPYGGVTRSAVQGRAAG